MLAPPRHDIPAAAQSLSPREASCEPESTSRGRQTCWERWLLAVSWSSAYPPHPWIHGSLKCRGSGLYALLTGDVFSFRATARLPWWTPWPRTVKGFIVHVTVFVVCAGKPARRDGRTIDRQGSQGSWSAEEDEPSCWTQSAASRKDAWPLRRAKWARSRELDSILRRENATLVVVNAVGWQWVIQSQSFPPS